ncbi:hypothetical protein RGQ13_18015 [Thalassotalea psychrophila]|uniref:Adenylate cyclase n=1 Tax=Thalassotalea psychrophila TaxID=3065647 RepID=A0ABY9TT66_9GAMM|nr:hypothetical protein RGQ13_18015 [Colwelliaceae bacterium SQ149]
MANSLFKELKRRNVFKVAIAYLVVAWIVLQVSALLLPILQLPDWVHSLVFFLGLIAFPFVLIFAWAFELTPEGIKRESRVEREHSIADQTGRKIDFVIIGLLVIVAFYFFYESRIRQNLQASNQPATAIASVGKSSIQDRAIEESEKSIAVLPFVNMSSDPEQEYFSDGLSEEILNLLAQVPSLKVIGRTSSFAFKGKNEDLRVIGKALNTKTVLEGSVRKSGERVRITAQLIDVETGTHLWSQSYDHTLTDIFAVQDSVAKAILEALQVHVLVPTRGRPTENIEAYGYYLKAKDAMSSWDTKSAESNLKIAVKLDPTFAEAYELLAYSYYERWGNTLDSLSAMEHMANAANNALQHDPSLIMASIFSKLSSGSWQQYEGIINLYRLLKRQPNNVMALEMLIWDLLIAGYFNEALKLSQQLVDVDPLSSNAQWYVFTNMMALGRRDEAIDALKLSAQLSGTLAHFNLAYLSRLENQQEQSLQYFEKNMQQLGLPWQWVRPLSLAASDPETGEANLDREIPKIINSVPKERAYEMRQVLLFWYLQYGHLDRYYQLIFERYAAGQDVSDADSRIFEGLIYRNTGFTAHPYFIKLAKKRGLIELWEQRGAPDYCKKSQGKWQCH